MNHYEAPRIRGLYAADLADRLERLPLESAREILRQLSPSEGGLVLAELEPANAAALLAGCPIEQTTAWLVVLSPHVVADLVFALPVPRRQEVMAALPPAHAAEVTALLRYPPDTAGGIMDNRFRAMRPELRVDECLARLRAQPDQRPHELLYLYVTESDGRLVGVVSVRSLVFAPADQHLGDIMMRKVRFLRVDDDQEEVARQVQHDHFFALPVVDEHQRLVGVIRIREALRVAENEATEDMQLMVGLPGMEHIWTPWRQALRKRLPWLAVNLATAFGAAAVVSSFEDTIARWSVLVAFLPLVCAVAGNGGNQALTVVIRSLAVGEFKAGDATRVLNKELLIGAGTGFALALAIGLIAFIWKGSVLLALVAGTAMVLNQVIGAFSGVAIPLVLRWCRVDPALASSILVTALTDAAGFLIFLGLASLVLGMAAP